MGRQQVPLSLLRPPPLRPPRQHPAPSRAPPATRPPPQIIQQYLKVEGPSIKYIGPGQDDSQAASVRSDNPVPPDVPLYYFEVTILNKGAEGYIGACKGKLKARRGAGDP